MSKELKRFIITVSTNWCGADEEYAAVAECAEDLHDVAEELAYDNFLSYNFWENIAEEDGVDTSEMTQEEWEDYKSSIDESEYYNYTIEEFNGTEEDWNYYARYGIYKPDCFYK